MEISPSRPGKVAMTFISSAVKTLPSTTPPLMTRCSFFFAAFAMIGAAVGLGNIWRFSYVLYSNGGGSFFIPYFTAIAIMGIPFLILEYGVGFSFKESFSKILKGA